MEQEMLPNGYTTQYLKMMINVISSRKKRTETEIEGKTSTTKLRELTGEIRENKFKLYLFFTR